jgi:glutamate synthase (NADPH/NADH) small chain
VIGAEGKASHLICSKMQLGIVDESGRSSPVDTGETFTLEADMIIKATGQMPFSELVATIATSHTNGKLVIDEKNSTNITGVFAGGDAVNGGREVVDAVQAGKDGARSILEYMGVGT